MSNIAYKTCGNKYTNTNKCKFILFNKNMKEKKRLVPNTSMQKIGFGNLMMINS